MENSDIDIKILGFYNFFAIITLKSLGKSHAEKYLDNIIKNCDKIISPGEPSVQFPKEQVERTKTKQQHALLLLSRIKSHAVWYESQKKTPQIF